MYNVFYIQYVVCKKCENTGVKKIYKMLLSMQHLCQIWVASWTDGGVVRDESIGFPPPSEESSVDGGVVAWMSSLSGKQHLQGLKRIQAVRTERQQRSRCVFV